MKQKIKTISIDMWNQTTNEEVAFTLRTGSGTEMGDATQKILVIYETEKNNHTGVKPESRNNKK